MKSHSVLSKLALAVFTALTVNQMACNNASFEAADSNRAQTAPAPDNVDNPFNQTDSGDVVRCDNLNTVFCNQGDDGLTPDVPPLTFTPPTYTVTVDGNCMENNYADTKLNNINGVTVWLVVDSSRSFDDERVAVGRALAQGFLQTLRRNVPVTVSVIASHAPSGSYAGRPSYAPEVNSSVFYRHSSEPLSVTFHPNMSHSQVRAAENQLLSKLNASMQESPISLAKQAGGSVNVRGQNRSWALGGPHSGSDELGLKNFMDAMDRTSIPSGNAWVVLFLSDENDICTPNVRNGQVVYSHPNDEPEMQRLFCSGVTPSAVYSKAVNYAGSRPFALGALVYTLQAPIPANAHPQASLGVGYTSVVSRAGSQGAMIDLASKSYLGLQNVANRLIGEVASITNESAGYHGAFPLYDRSGRRLSLTSISTQGGQFNMQVYVDGVRSNYTTDNAQSLVRPSRKGERVRIRFCTR